MTDSHPMAEKAGETARLLRERATRLVAPVVGFLMWIYLYLAVLLGAWVALGMLLGGWSPLVVTSGSMEPTLSVGDVLLLDEAPEEELAQRAVVAFERTDGTRVVHRIFAIEGDQLVTKGDANPTPDADRVDPSDVGGIGRLVVPLVGMPAVWLADGNMVALGAWAVVTVGSVLQFLATARRRADQGFRRAVAGRLPVAQLGVRRVRFLVALLILVQHILDPSRFDVLGNESGRLWLLLGSLAVLLGTNVVSARNPEIETGRGAAYFELVIDTLLVVTLATLTGSAGIGWVLFALPIIEAAVRFGLVGALTHWIMLTIVTLGARIWTADLRASSLLLDELEDLLDQLSVLFLVVVPGAYLVEQLMGDVIAQQRATDEATDRTKLLEHVAEAGHEVTRLGGGHLAAIVSGVRRLGFDHVDVAVARPDGWRVIDGDPTLPPPGSSGSGVRPIDLITEAVVVDADDPDPREAEALAAHDLGGLIVQTVSDRRGRVVLRAAVSSDRRLGRDQADAFLLLGRQASVALQNDELLAELTSAHDELHHQARHDALTGLPNRAMLLQRLSELLEPGHATISLLFLDLNGFKPVNDRLGHDVGDELLRLVAERLNHTTEERALVARLGGDEFTVLIDDLPTSSTAVDLALEIAAHLREPFSVGGEIVNISASIGIAFSEDGLNEGEVLRRADVAMYHAKRQNDLGYAVYQSFMDEEEMRRGQLAGDLRSALVTDGIHLVYQPIYRVGERASIVGSEALVRWDHPRFGPIPSGEIVEIARSAELLDDLNRWIVGRACRDTAELLGRVPGLPYFVTVNASPEELASNELVRHVQDSIVISGLTTAHVMVEISERLVAIDDPVVNGSMRNLRQAGIGLLLDDFGEGHTSLSYLNELPVNGIKLDRKLVVNTMRSSTDRIILESIIDLCRRLDLVVVAEGVENEQQLDTVTAAGTSLVQGYYFKRPVPFAELLDLVEFDAGRARPGATGPELADTASDSDAPGAASSNTHSSNNAIALGGG